MALSCDALVFDAYGTLFDVHAVMRRCESYWPGKGGSLSQLWRTKQLEYTWQRSLMRCYAPFSKVTRDALEYACEALGLPLADSEAASLMAEYLNLAAYPDVADALPRLRAARRSLPVGAPAPEELVELRVPVPDRAGVLAEVTTLAGRLGVNISDLEIAHSVDAVGGVLVMVVAAVSNVVYTYFVSRLGPDAIGAVSLVFPVSLLAITAMGGGIGAGATSAVARALGAGRPSEAAALAGQALLLSLAIGVGFGLAVQVGSPALFHLMGASGAIHANATHFARILFGGAAITFLGAMFDSVMRGEGNVRVPAIWSTTSLVLQMGATPLFMFGLGLGLEGAALAMLACQLLATLPRAVWVLGGRGTVRPVFRPRRTGFRPVREVLRVGVPAALSTSISNVGLMALTAVVARLGAPQPGVERDW